MEKKDGKLRLIENGRLSRQTGAVLERWMMGWRRTGHGTRRSEGVTGRGQLSPYGRKPAVLPPTLGWLSRGELVPNPKGATSMHCGPTPNAQIRNFDSYLLSD